MSIKDIHKVINAVVTMSLLVVTAVFFYSCEKDDDAPADSGYAESRTVMVYMVAENSLNGNVTADINEMIQGMKDNTLQDADRLVVFLDDVKLPRIYLIDKQTKASSLAQLEPVKIFDEDFNSASAESLGTFIEHTKQAYPADSYGLVLWSHASGWIPSTKADDLKQSSQLFADVLTPAGPRYSFALDNMRNTTSNAGGHEMNVSDMAKAIEDKGGVDFILFDACLMQGVEIAYELRHAAKYIVGSPAEIPYYGADYTTMTQAMFRRDDYVEQMVSAYFNAYNTPAMQKAYGSVISAIKTSELESFATYMRSVIAAHKDELLQLKSNSCLNYFKHDSWSTAFPDAFDVQGLMKIVLSDTDFATWKEHAAQIMAVPCQHTSSWYSEYPRAMISINDEQCLGVNMFIPLNKFFSKFNDAYYQTEWAKAVWNEN